MVFTFVYSSIVVSTIMVMEFSAVLLIMIPLLLLGVLRLWLSNHDETIIFKLFDLVPSELTNFFRGL
jgi:hypothetical protein